MTGEALRHYDGMPFGQYKDWPMLKVPAWYLLKLYERRIAHAGVRQYIVDNLEGLKREALADRNNLK